MIPYQFEDQGLTVILNDQKASRDENLRLAPWSVATSNNPLLDLPMTKDELLKYIIENESKIRESVEKVIVNCLPLHAPTAFTK